MKEIYSILHLYPLIIIKHINNAASHQLFHENSFSYIKIVDEDLFYDFHLNTTESVIGGTYRQEVLDKIQTGFENQYNLYGKLKREVVKSVSHETLQARKRIQRHIILKK